MKRKKNNNLVEVKIKKLTFINGYAEIGIQVPLRTEWINPCEFKSRYPYMKNIK